MSALIVGLSLIPAGRVTAQTFTNLHSFTIGSDGANPYAGLILSGNTLYGTANGGGSLGQGTVFAVYTNGTGFTNLHSFTGSSDGANPYSELILLGNALYGTTYHGGSSGQGTVFAVNINGTGFTNLHSFTAVSGSFPYTNSDGANPYAGMILSSNTLYGTARGGGSSGAGTVFAVNIDGTGFTNLHSFTAVSGSSPYTNSDGAHPQAGLILSGNTLFGTAYYGGISANGAVFAVNIDGSGFTNLHHFTALSNSTNSDGAAPEAGMILSGNTLYGTALNGGSSGNGTVFAVNIDGTGFTNLYSFTAATAGTNSDGGNPFAGLILSGNTLYGTAVGGGSSGAGTVFAVNTNGTGFTNLHSFTALSGSNGTNSDGANPFAGLILSGNTLYGSARSGGSSGKGTVFSLSLGAPQLSIIRSSANVILRWPTNAIGFTLQSTTNLVSPAVWSTVSPDPTVVNGQNAVTNPLSGSQNFYRLRQ